MGRSWLRTAVAGRRAGTTLILRAAAVLAGVTSLALAFATAPGVAAPPVPPTASFVYTPSSPLVNQTVTFTSTSTPAGNGNAILKNEWDLDGNGTFETNTGAQPVASHVYGAPGPVKVSLRVTDKRAATAVTFRTVTITAPGANQPPVASFAYSPLSPLAGESVSFYSTSTDSDSAIASQQWDLNGDGVFGDATGPMAVRSFTDAGSYMVSLRVTDSANAASVATQTVVVGARAGTSGSPAVTGKSKSSRRLLAPFPIVRIVGTVTTQGTILKRMSVSAPRRAKVTVRCRGRHCPIARWTRAAAPASASAARLLRVRRLERRILVPGLRIEVLVTRRGFIGKYTRFTIRRGRGPARLDRCLVSGSQRPKRCPGT